MIVLNYQITKKSHKCTFRVSRKYRARGAVFKVPGHLFELGWGWGGGGGKFRQFFPYGCLEQPGILDLS